MGNITSKSDVGSFTYDASKKHQVTSTSNGWNFAYDENGNMTSGRGRTIEWTSYNYPSCIREGADCDASQSQYSTFSYTPNRQYWRQVSKYTTGGMGTTIYVGGVLEKVTTNGGTDYRHMIRAGSSTIIVSRNTSGTNTTSYVTSDHLGSSSVITNSAGSVLISSSFSAHGKRRGLNWTGNPNSGDWAAIAGTTRRAYTDHSMLDNLDLIHMNGRVQDPLIGRFLSADPYVADPLSTQSYNRYSYVENNPLTYADPSGFVPVLVPFPCIGYDTRGPMLGTSSGEGGGASFTFSGGGGLVSCGYTAFYVDIPEYPRPEGETNDPANSDVVQPIAGWLGVCGRDCLKVVSQPEAGKKPWDELAWYDKYIYTSRGTWQSEYERLSKEQIAERVAQVSHDIQSSAMSRENSLGPSTRVAGAAASAARAARGGSAFAREAGILRDAARGKGNFGLGSGTRAEAERLGRTWVGDGAKLASDGKTLVSADGLRQFRPPSFKPNLGIEQANFEQRLAPSGQWFSNGHLDIGP